MSRQLYIFGVKTMEFETPEVRTSQTAAGNESDKLAVNKLREMARSVEHLVFKPVQMEAK